MKQSTTALRPEALPPRRSALPIILALSTTLLAGALGGFLMATALPGEDEPAAPVTPATMSHSLLERLLEPTRVPPCTEPVDLPHLHLLGVGGLKAL